MSMGEGSYSQTKLRDEIEVGKYSSIASDCHFHETGDNHLCAINHQCVFTFRWDQPKTKEISIGNDVWIGHGVRLLPGVQIGDGAIIGAGAVVTKDVPPFAVLVGNPPVIKRFRFTDEQIKKLEKIGWWNWNSQEIDKAKEDLKDIDKFLEKYG